MNNIESEILVILCILIAGFAIVVLFAIHKLRRIHLFLFKIAREHSPEQVADRLFPQIQALHDLYTELRLTRGLPTMRGWAASPDFLLHVAREALESKPKIVLECGSGASTIVLARCAQLNGNGRILSLEHDPEYAQLTRRNLRRHGLEEFATVVDAPLQSYDLGGRSFTWYRTDQLPEALAIDLLVVDGPPLRPGTHSRYPASEMLFPKLTPHASVYLDDAAREDEQWTVEKWLRDSSNARVQYLAAEKGCAVIRFT